jgi:hypothetical protein
VDRYRAFRCLLGRLERHSLLTHSGLHMPSDRCKQCDQSLGEIDHYGERLTGCPTCNLWQASTGEWCRLAPDDIVALRALKDTNAEADDSQSR